MPWVEVGEALRGIEAWQVLVLLGLVLLRAVVLALPLNLLMPEITPVQAARGELVGNLVANFAPPPADIGVRVAMLGFVVILLTRRFDEEYLQIALQWYAT